MIRVWPRRGRWLIALVILLWPATNADAAESTSRELAELARTVRKVLDGHGETRVRLGLFHNQRDKDAGLAPGLRQRMQMELDGLGIKVDPQAPFALEGEYVDKQDRSKRVFIELSCRIVDAKGTVIVRFIRGIFGEDALVEFLAPTAVALDPGIPEQEREKVLIRQIDSQIDGKDAKPAVVLDGARVFADKDRTYSVEILVKGVSSFEPRKPVIEQGQVFVPLGRAEVFMVRLHSGSPHETAVRLVIDGIDSFAFCDGLAKATNKAVPRWLVPRGGNTVVRGWPIRDGLSNEFLVTEYAKSAAAELHKDRTKVGVLTVLFAACWVKGAAPPADEPAGAREAVGRGAPVETPLRVVPRSFGRLRAALTLRYHRD